MDKLEKMIIGAEIDVEQNKNILQASIKKLIELLQEQDITDQAYYQSYIAQIEDVRRLADKVIVAKTVHKALTTI
jgi:hypothetical protein